MLNYKGTKCTTTLEFLKLFKKGEFKSPYRSTIPLICMVRDQPELLKPLLEDGEVVFEYEIKPKKGTGFPSCSDLAMFNQKTCVIIEAKRTEPEYELVEKWNDGSENRKKVLEGWLEYINDYTGSAISILNIQKLPYQLIHRTASACAMGKENTKLFYIIFEFTEEKEKYYKAILKEMKTLTGSKITYQYGFFNLEKSQLQVQFEKKWDRGDRDFEKEIKDGINNSTLMKIIKKEIKDI